LVVYDDGTITQSSIFGSCPPKLPRSHPGPATFTFYDFSQGNVFKVYDNGALILTTTLVGGYAYGQVMLAAGAHALTVNWASQTQPGNFADEFGYRINQEALLGLTVSDDSSGDTATAITNGAVKTLTVAGTPWAGDQTLLDANVSIDPGITQDTDTNRVYLSIERKNKCGLTDETIFCGPLSQLTAADCTLTTDAQTADFVILEWVDGKGDGQFDAGDDSREVDVNVVTPWTALGTWTAGQAAMVQANADGASLAALALSITGNVADASALGGVGPITEGEQIDVTPLLILLQQRVSDQVVIAAQQSTRYARFGTKGALVPQYNLWNMEEAQIDSIFVAGSLSKLKPNQWPRYNCNGMGAIDLARGLIVGAALDNGEFDALNLHPSDFAEGGGGQYLVFWPKALPLASVPNGYLVCFDNNIGYSQHGAWANEWAIKTGPDAFIGWGIRRGNNWSVVLSDAQMKQELCDQFNKGLWWWQTIGVQDVPGYAGLTGVAEFLNIPLLAQRIFNVRTGQ
jgi:hypothetical protein